MDKRKSPDRRKVAYARWKSPADRRALAAKAVTPVQDQEFIRAPDGFKPVHDAGSDNGRWDVEVVRNGAEQIHRLRISRAKE